MPGGREFDLRIEGYGFESAIVAVKKILTNLFEKIPLPKIFSGVSIIKLSTAVG